jgi:electron transport complex protein RnfG
MKEVFKITFVLTITCIVCALFLSLIFSWAQEKIKLNEIKRIQDSFFKLEQDAERIEEEEIGGKVIYKIFDKNNKLLSYGFIAQGGGYQGTIKIASVINLSLDKLKGIEIIESVETPGLGAKIQEDFFKKQFKDLLVLPKIELIKDKIKKKNEVKAITGATVSSSAVVNILNNEIEKLKKIIKK